MSTHDATYSTKARGVPARHRNRTRGGRSPLGCRTISIRVRLNAVEHAILAVLAKKRGQTMADLLREAVLGQALGRRVLCAYCSADAIRRANEAAKGMSSGEGSDKAAESKLQQGGRCGSAKLTRADNSRRLP